MDNSCSEPNTTNFDPLYCKCHTCLLENTTKCPKITRKNQQPNTVNINIPPHTTIQNDNSTIPANVCQFRAIVNDLADLYSRKNQAYGNSFSKSVERYGPISALTRMSDKWNRLENLILGGTNNVADEKVTDTLLDLASYAIMTYMELNKK